MAKKARHSHNARRPNPADVLIVGGGLAGLSLALRLADHMEVVVLAKSALTEGSSLYAQGGIAAVLDQDEDSFLSHVEDTLRAGAGLCHEDTVKFVVQRGPESVRWLIDQGISFTQDSTRKDEEHAEGTAVMAEPPAGKYHLAREGGHTHRRIIHVADATGRSVVTTLEEKVRRHPHIRLHENHIAIDLITSHKLGWPGENRCVGLYVLDKNTHNVEAFPAKFTVLATGGTAKVYLYSSNPDTSTGDGIAMAWRAGCRVANMEFIQFHPTCLYHPRAKSFLISEAVRGEGGRLLLPNGEPFMQRHDPRGELASRDIVARAIDYEMKRGGHDYVYLDISHKPADFILSHFPNIYERCREFGYDMTREPIPIVPAAHYTCGGIMTDLHGRTDMPSLYALGECAFTGLHGANRLASNSLLECLVFAESAACDIQNNFRYVPPSPGELPAWDESRVTDADEQVIVSHNWDELRRFMWDYVGIVRTTKRLERAQHRVNLLSDEIREYYSNFKISNDLLELRNLVLVAELIIRSALNRTESRGLHFSRDYPALQSRPPHDTLLTPANFAGVSLSPGLAWKTPIPDRPGLGES